MTAQRAPTSRDAVRIAMWSGPRNISTALMRSWGSRPDTYVCDEPLYAHYLLVTGRRHPGRGEILRRHETNADRVTAWLTGRVPEGKRIFYQKQMAHHLLPGAERDWLSAVRHAFLIREPQEMLTSLIRVTSDPSLDDTGLPQQWELFERAAAETGTLPPVIDARDVLEDRDVSDQIHAMFENMVGDAIDEYAPDDVEPDHRSIGGVHVSPESYDAMILT